MAGLQGWHLLIVLVVILLLFGASKLPALARSMGQSARVFKGELNAMKDEDAARAEQRVADPVDGTIPAPEDTTPPAGSSRSV